MTRASLRAPRFVFSALLALLPCISWAQRPELLELNQRLDELRRHATSSDGVVDLGAEAIVQRATEIRAVQRELAALDAQSWVQADKVDYLLVWAKGNALAFEHRVTQPWARDPIFHLDLVKRVPYAVDELATIDLEDLATRLERVPRVLAQAEAVLTEAAGELADQAIFHLESFDGVGQGEPYRDQPPAGTIGWYQELCTALERRASEETAAPGAVAAARACAAALAAVRGYRDWLREVRPTLQPSAGIGRDELAWYLSHVRLLPFTVEEAVLLGEREFQRYRTAWEIVRNRNDQEGLPPLELTRSAAQHEERTRAAEALIRQTVDRQRLLTWPDDLPEAFDTDTFFSLRALEDRHFWEEIQFRNALNNHIHASIPGHRFDGLMARRMASENPIRASYGDSTRAEGWATYLEELLMLAGITRSEPRAEELFYVALMKRASRIVAETKMHAGEFSLEQANEYLIDFVPFMEEELGRYDLEGYLRRPGSGSGYILGKIQLEALIAERSLELGEEFSLGELHDEVLRRGMIPLVLVRWELTGERDEVAPLWRLATGVELGAAQP